MGLACKSRAPYWDEKSGDYEEGFFCRACAWRGYEFGVPRQWCRIIDLPPVPSWGVSWKRYTRDGMRAHLQEYGRTRKMSDIDAIETRSAGHYEGDIERWMMVPSMDYEKLLCSP